MKRDAAIALFEALVATNQMLERKGDTMPYTSLNGHMICVPDALLRKTADLQPYFDQSVAYVASLKPKATTKQAKKAAGKKS